MSISATFKVKKIERRTHYPRAVQNKDGSISAIPYGVARVYADRIVDGNPNAGAIAFDGDPLSFWGDGIAEGDTLLVTVEVVKGMPPDERVTLRAAVESERVAKEIAAEEALVFRAEVEALRAEKAERAKAENKGNG